MELRKIRQFAGDVIVAASVAWTVTLTVAAVFYTVAQFFI